MAAFTAGKVANVSECCLELGISRKTFYKYVHRFTERGVDGFYPDSRRPRSSPSQVGPGVVEAIVRARTTLRDSGFDYGAWAIREHLIASDGPDVGPVPSLSTINRVLDRQDLRDRVPSRRPRSSWRRFERDHVNGLWQMDGFEVALATGVPATVIHVVDDCSRKDLALHVASGETADAAWDGFLAAVAGHGVPAELLTDNSLAFNGSRRGVLTQLEVNTRALGVRQIASSAGHPQTAGKAERAHQRVRKWLRQHPPAANAAALQLLLNAYQDDYNNRPNRVLGGLTPAQRYDLGPVAAPAQPTAATTIVERAVSINGLVNADGSIFYVGATNRHKTAVVVRIDNDVTIYVDHALAGEFRISPTRTYYTPRPSPKS